jgi:L-amino acid N-acyltransferase YncA
VEKGFHGWFSRLAADEIILESAYTFEKYRGNRIAPSFVAHLLEIYRNRGFKRARVYIDKNREAQMEKAEEGGFKRCEEINILKILSFTIMKSGPYQPALA